MFSNPVQNLKALGLHEDSVVVDLGAGTGFYSIATGQIVSRGKVYAVEIDKDFLMTIASKVKDAHLNNIEVIWGNIEKKGGTKLADGIADVVILSNVFSQVNDKDACIQEIERILRPKGRVLFVDWSPDSEIFGSKATRVAISKNEAQETFFKNGFILMREIDAGEHHYGMIFIK